MAYLFAAFLVLWAFTFGYIYSIGARQKRLQQELEALKNGEDDYHTPGSNALRREG